MRLAHIIMAHNDSEFIVRLVKKLSVYSDVFIHIDSNTQEEPFHEGLRELEGISVYFMQNRYH